MDTRGGIMPPPDMAAGGRRNFDSFRGRKIMRRILLLLASSILFAAGGASAGQGYIWFAENSFGVELSDAWTYTVLDDRRRVEYAHRDFPGCVLTIDAPNPVFKGGRERYLGVNIGMAYLGYQQHGEITMSKEGVFDDKYPIAIAMFLMPSEADPQTMGFGQVIDYDGYLISSLLIGPTEYMTDFIDAVQPVMESLIFDREDAEANRDALVIIGNDYTNWVAELTGSGVPWGKTVAKVADTVFEHYIETHGGFAGADDGDADDWDGDDGELADEGEGSRPARPVRRAEGYDPYDVGHWGDPVVSAEREWTVLVYLDGDNDLETAALFDLVEMEEGLVGVDGGKVDVVVLLDRAEGYNNGWGDWTGTRVYHVQADKGDGNFNSRLLSDCNELNMTSPWTLESFINEGTRVFPAPKTALVLWDHGGGWADMLNDLDAPIGEDVDEEYAADGMTLAGLRSALSRTAANYPDGKLDLLVFDMCLMGQAETLVATASYVKYLVASPSLAPASGLDYKRGVPLFASGLPTGDIAAGLVKTAFEGYRDHGREDGSMAAYDLSGTGTLMAAFSRMAGKLNTLVPITWAQLTRSIFLSLNYGGRRDLEQRAGSCSSIDVLDWIDRLKKVVEPSLLRELTSELADLEKAVADVILYHERGAFYPNSRGLAMYAPLREGNLNDAYHADSFGAYSKWSQVLVDLHYEQGENAGTPPRISSIEFGQIDAGQGDGYAILPSEEMSASDGGEKAGQVRLVVDGINILWVSGGFALCSQESTDVFIPVAKRTILNRNIINPTQAGRDVKGADEEIPVFRDGRNVLTYRLDGYLTAVGNEEEFSLAYPQYVDPAKPAMAIIVAEWRREHEEEWQRVIIETFQDKLVMMYSAADGAIADIVPGPRDRFRTVLPVFEGGEQTGLMPGAEIAWGENPGLVFRPLPESRHIRVMCMAESLAGVGSVATSRPILITE